jgi:hypothetical protein
MAVMARDVWTDERLDDLNKRVDEGFKETREEFRVVRTEMKREFQAIRTEMGEVRSEVNALARVVAQLAFGLIGTMLFGFLGIIATLVVKI